MKHRNCKVIKSHWLITTKIPLAMKLFAIALICPTVFVQATNSYEGVVEVEIQQQAKQSIKVTGTVTDDQGESVIGAAVMVEGSKNGTVTDLNGHFSLMVDSEKTTLSVSFIGYKPTLVKVNGSSPLLIKLVEDTQTLDEVVVVGFGTQKKINMTGAVSQVTEETFKSRPVSSVSQALQGVVPGLNFSVGQEGGALNSNLSVDIRGAGTIGKGSTSAPLILIDGVEGNMNLVNSQDIESISVLKDAAASSVYGSRAPFGVILITTKQGKEGKATVNYNSNFRFNSPVSTPNAMDSYTFVNYFNEGRLNGGQSVFFDQGVLDRIAARNSGEMGLYIPLSTTNSNTFQFNSANGNTDWYDVHYKDWVLSQEHNVSLSGGTQKLSYYLSGNFMDQEGFLRYGGDEYYRYNVNAKINAQINKHISIMYNTRWTRTNYDRPSYLEENGLIYQDIVRRWPNMVPVDPNGYYTINSGIPQLLDGGRSKDDVDQMSHRLQLMITPLEDWRIIAEGNVRTTHSFYHTEVLPVYTHEVDGTPYLMAFSNNYSAGQSRVTEKSTKNEFYTTNIYSDYAHTIKGHSLKVMVGFNAELQKARTVFAQRDGLINPDIPTIDTATEADKVSGGYTHWATAGFFGRINYDYKGRYLLEMNGRYDGTSRFVDNKRWNFFPSFSAGWNIAKEAFWEPYQDVLNSFKLRGSWGELGNQNTSSLYPFFEAMPININSGGWLINGKKTNTANIPGLISQMLTWERVQSMNIGLDVAALNNRLTGSAEFFVRKTLDMVGPAPELPATLGIAVPSTNNANMKSVGWELELSWRDRIGAVKYGVKFNLSDATQEVTEYPNETWQISDWYAGKRMGSIWGYRSAGIAKSQEEMDAHLASLPNGGQKAIGGKWRAGDVMYIDLNGDGKIDAGQGTLSDHGDREIIGNSTPRYRYGIILDASYLGFDVSAFFQGVGKRDFAPANGANGAVFWGTVNNTYQSVGFEEHLDYFRPEGHPFGANLDGYYPIPDMSTSKNQQTQTRYLQDASYIRLKNIQLGYTLPKMLLSKFYVNSLRLYISGENLWTHTKLSSLFDPETLAGEQGQGKTYPLSKVISLGVNINF